MESASGMCFLELYIKNILALGVRPPSRWTLHRPGPDPRRPAQRHPHLRAAAACRVPTTHPTLVLPAHLRGLQAKAGRALPLAIMTSDDTHARTLALLEAHAYWGAAPGQVMLIKQEKVACLAGRWAAARRAPRPLGRRPCEALESARSAGCLPAVPAPPQSASQLNPT